MEFNIFTQWCITNLGTKELSYKLSNKGGVVCLRFSVFLLLGLVIAGIGYASYFISRGYEIVNFEDVYQSSVDHISREIDENIKSKLLAVTVASQIYSQAIDVGYVGVVPNVTLPGFENIMTPLARLVGAAAIAFYPILDNKINRKSWESYAQQHVDDLHGPKDLKDGSWPVYKGISTQNSTRIKSYAPGYVPTSLYPNLVAPVWQIAPISSTWTAIMDDSHSHPGRTEVIDRVIQTKKIGFSDLVGLAFGSSLIPATSFYAPILSKTDQSVIGLIGSVLTWDRVLQDALPSYISGFSCVLKSNNKMITLLLTGGTVHVVGEGDLHDEKYNKYERVITQRIRSFKFISTSNYTLTIYPTDELYHKYITNGPGVMCGSFVAIIVFTTMVLMCYDYCVRRRERQLQGQVESTTKITNHTLHQLDIKKNFVRYISHEVRTPLSTVKMGLEVLQNDMLHGATTAQIAETVDEIKGLCQSALEVVNDFLLFDKIVSDKLTLELVPSNIYALVEDTVQAFLIQSRQKCVSLVVDTDLANSSRMSTPNILVDKYKFIQVVRNLVSNALKFTPRNGTVTVRVRRDDRCPNFDEEKSSSSNIGSSEELRPGMFIVDVIDTGAGISAENQKRLFKDIVQFNPSELQGGGGSGLGLYISYGIVKQHGGDMSVFSEGLGLGTTFSLHIHALSKKSLEPRSQQFLITAPSTPDNAHRISLNKFQRQSETPVTSEIVPSGHGGDATGSRSSEDSLNLNLVSIAGLQCPTRNWLSILVVDDTVSNRKMLCRMLQRSVSSYAYVCKEAVDGSDAVEIMKRSIESIPQTSPADQGVLDDSANIRNLCDWSEPPQLTGDTGDVHAVDDFDVIIMDYFMPRMKGPEATRAIRALGYRGLILGATAHAGDQEQRDFIDSGADAVLSKPVDVKILTSIIHTHMERGVGI